MKFVLGILILKVVVQIWFWFALVQYIYFVWNSDQRLWISSGMSYSEKVHNVNTSLKIIAYLKFFRWWIFNRIWGKIISVCVQCNVCRLVSFGTMKFYVY
jgi:hypothetical protein